MTLCCRLQFTTAQSMTRNDTAPFCCNRGRSTFRAISMVYSRSSMRTNCFSRAFKPLGMTKREEDIRIVSLSVQKSPRTTLMTTENMILYAHAMSENTPVLAAFVPHNNGWRCRSTARGQMQHDYGFAEVDALLEWMQADFGPNVSTTFEREEALELLSTLLEAPGEVGPSFRFHGAAAASYLSGESAAEQVLQHLERGW